MTTTGPRLLTACEFAIGENRQNIILLHIDADPDYENARDMFGIDKFSAHGGLTVRFDSKKQIPTCFESSISFGAIRYKF